MALIIYEILIKKHEINNKTQIHENNALIQSSTYG